MRIFLLSVLITVTLALQAQPAVYRINDLLQRIQNADTTYVVNFWATWCKPCVKELPSFDSLHVKSRDKALKVLLVSLDFREDLEKRVVPFLKIKKILSECVLLDESNGNDFINQISEEWSGAIPATLIRKGDRITFAERSLDLSELQKMVRDIETLK